MIFAFICSHVAPFEGGSHRLSLFASLLVLFALSSDRIGRRPKFEPLLRLRHAHEIRPLQRWQKILGLSDIRITCSIAHEQILEVLEHTQTREGVPVRIYPSFDSLDIFSPLDVRKQPCFPSRFH